MHAGHIRHATALLLLAACAAPDAGDGQGVDHATTADPGAEDAPNWVNVPNFVVLNDRVAGGGQPDLDEIPRLRERGYATIINLQTSAEDGVAEEAEAARAAGIHYVHVPVTGSTLNVGDALRVSEALRNAPPGDVLLHCRSGGRVAMTWGLVRGIEDGLWPHEAARVAQNSGRPISDDAAGHVAEQLEIWREDG